MEKKKKTKKWVIALIVIVILVLAVIAFRDMIMNWLEEFLFRHIYASW